MNQRMSRTHSHRFLAQARPFGLLLGLASTAACTEPPVDDNQPEPKGVIEGTVQYIGRPVDCDVDAMGRPTQVRGRILMTLVDDANPLPPEGTATAPVDFFAIGGEDIFTDLDNECALLPADATRIMQRSVSFRWANIPLGRSYRIQAFYDQEGDFNPLFSVQQATSAGDVAGGALANPTAAVAKFEVITFPTKVQAPFGYVRPGINVSLGGVVATDAPMMRIVDGDVNAEGYVTVPAPQFLPSLDLALYGRLPTDADRAVIDPTLAAMNMSNQVNFGNPVAYAWYVAPLDVDRDGNTDCPSASDGDCHPVLGTLGQTWRSPVVLLQRVRNAIEVAANVPTVALIPQAGIEASSPQVQYPNLRTRLLPFAAVLTNPDQPACAAAYFADKTLKQIIDGAQGSLGPYNTVECSELPTGYFGVNALGGLVVTSPTAIAMEPNTAISQTGWNITGGSFGSQLWTIPNELGDWRQVDDTILAGQTDPGTRRCLGAAADPSDPPICLPEQSLAGAAVVHDPNPTNAYSRRAPGAAAANICTQYDFSADPWRVGGPDHDTCCGPILHLCDVPLCPVEVVNQTWSSSVVPALPNVVNANMNVRGQPTSARQEQRVVNGETITVTIPNCIPFAMPTACCGTENQP